MEARFSRPGVRWVFLAGVFAVAGALAFSGGRIALANHYAARETSEGLGRAAHLEPGNAEHWYFLGRYWQYNFDQPDLPLAISYYQRALALDPRSANTWMDLAGAREAQGDTAQAREAFEQAQKAHPISADVAWRYANFFLRQGDIRQAYSQVCRAVAADPNRAATAVSVCWRANPNIEMILDQALPRSAAVYLEAIRFLSNEHEGSAALAVCKRLAELHPRIELQTVFPLLDELFVEDLIQQGKHCLQLDPRVQLRQPLADCQCGASFMFVGKKANRFQIDRGASRQGLVEDHFNVGVGAPANRDGGGSAIRVRCHRAANLRVGLAYLSLSQKEVRVAPSHVGGNGMGLLRLLERFAGLRGIAMGFAGAGKVHPSIG